MVSLFIHILFNMYFHIFPLVNCAAIKIRLQIAFSYADFASFEYSLKYGMAELYGRSVVSSMSTLYTDFHRGCTSLHSH